MGLLRSKNRFAGWLASAVGLCVCILLSKHFAAACIIGMLSGWAEPLFASAAIRFKPLCLLGVLSPIAAFCIPMVHARSIAFSLLILCLPGVPALRKAFESRSVLHAGRLSFGIYAMHWPVFLSVGLLVFKRSFLPALGANLSLALVWLICFAATWVLALLFSITAERFSALFCRRLGKLLR